MDLQKADYGTVIKFGSQADFNNKLLLERQNLSEIINQIDINGVSLLEKALISRKFDIVKYFLNEGARVNIVSNEGFNELHYLAANINFEDAIEIARQLISSGVDLDHIDKKYGNSAMISLCLEFFKQRTELGMSFIEEMVLRKPNLDIANKSGVSTRALLKDRGTDRIKKILEEV